MKVIAKSGNRTYILEATSEEIDSLAGRDICSGKYGEQKDANYVLGVKFDIGKAFAQIHRNDQRKREIEMVRKTLEGVVNSLDIIDRFIEEPKQEELATDSTRHKTEEVPA